MSMPLLLYNKASTKSVFPTERFIFSSFAVELRFDFCCCCWSFSFPENHFDSISIVHISVVYLTAFFRSRKRSAFKIETLLLREWCHRFGVIILADAYNKKRKWVREIKRMGYAESKPNTEIANHKFQLLSIIIINMCTPLCRSIQYRGRDGNGKCLFW